MKFPVPDELKKIASLIIGEGKSESAWALLESDDAFQEGSLIGGFDATESAFCFSYYNHDGKEFWFQLTLEEIEKTARGELASIDGREAD